MLALVRKRRYLTLLLALSGCGDDGAADPTGTTGDTSSGSTGTAVTSGSTATTATTTATGSTTDTGSTTATTSSTNDTDSTTGTGSTDTGDATTTGGGLSPLDQAVEAIGGDDVLSDLEFLQITANGERWVDYEARAPGGLMEVSSYASTFTFDVPNRNLRLDTERTPLFEALSFGPLQEFSIVVNDQVGGLGAQAGFVPPGNFPSQHVAALTTQQRLFNPHFFLREALADPRLAGDGGDADVDGAPHRIITFAGDVTEIQLFVDVETGFISKLETVENHPLARDVPIEVRYEGWALQGPLAFPDTVELYSEGALVHEETRTAIEVEPDLAADTFDLPPPTDNPMLDAAAYAFGEQTHQALEAFFSLAFLVTEEPAFMMTELVPGVTLLSSGANSMLVRYDQGLVLLEAPATPAYGDALVDAAAQSFPGVDITHVVQSHHHQDHSAGLRSVVAVGATAVVGNGVADFWDGVFSAESTIRPDELASAGIVPEIEEVPLDGTFQISDANVTITVHHVSNNPHADDMVFTTIERGGEVLVYEADLYNGGFGGTLVLGGPASFFAALRDRGIIDPSCNSAVPLTIVPAHGIAQTLAASLAELSGQGVDVGCP